jgi:hypothetical protein
MKVLPVSLVRTKQMYKLGCVCHLKLLLFVGDPGSLGGFGGYMLHFIPSGFLPELLRITLKISQELPCSYKL